MWAKKWVKIITFIAGWLAVGLLGGVLETTGILQYDSTIYNIWYAVLVAGLVAFPYTFILEKITKYIVGIIPTYESAFCATWLSLSTFSIWVQLNAQLRGGDTGTTYSDALNFCGIPIFLWLVSSVIFRFLLASPDWEDTGNSAWLKVSGLFLLIIIPLTTAILMGCTFGFIWVFVRPITI